MNATLDYLKMVVKVRNSAPPPSLKYSCIEEFVLKNGKAYDEVRAFPRDLKKGKMRECFRNAALLSMEKGWVYVEGYATSIIPTLHAWCADDEGKVVDPTWNDGQDYFGVSFSGEYLRKTLIRKKTFGLLDNLEMGFPLLTGEHPFPEEEEQRDERER